MSLGIRDLVSAKRLSAVSCMSNSPNWYTEASYLKPIADDIDVGLHFNITHRFDNNKTMGLGKLILQCLSRTVDRKWLEQEFNFQLDNFEQAFHQAPDFIDGHHHVHVFPVIRQIIIKVLNKRYGVKNNIWLRRIDFALQEQESFIKSFIIKMLAVNFDKLILTNGYQLSGNFTGSYSHGGDISYAELMDKWLSTATDKTLIMCHPRRGDLNSAAPNMYISDAEYNYLNSHEFIKSCEKYNFKISRLKSAQV